MYGTCIKNAKYPNFVVFKSYSVKKFLFYSGNWLITVDVAQNSSAWQLISPKCCNTATKKVGVKYQASFSGQTIRLAYLKRLGRP